MRFVPGERFRFCPVPGARNWVNFHLFVDIIHDCCSHMSSLVHLKRVNTKISNLYLKYNFETQKCQIRARYPFYHRRKQQSVTFTKISHISRRNC